MLIRLFSRLALALAALSLCVPAVAADNYAVKDANTTTISKCSRQQGDSSQADCAYTLPTENHVGEVGGHTIIAGCSASPCFTTTSATTAWSSGQLIGDSTTAASVTKMQFQVCRVTGGTGMIRRARIKIASDSGFAGQNVILYLYRDDPTLNAGDRATWNTTESNFLGKIPVNLGSHFSDFEKGTGVPIDSNGNATEINYDCASGAQIVRGLLVAGSAITPQAGSKAVTVVLEALTN